MAGILRVRCVNVIALGRFGNYLLLMGTDAFHRYCLNVGGRLAKDEGDNCGWHFTDEDFYLYLVAHEYAYYSMLGTGLRSPLGTYVCLTRKSGSMDWVYISREAGRLGIAGLSSAWRK